MTLSLNIGGDEYILFKQAEKGYARYPALQQ
jgi:hypothetical protein